MKTGESITTAAQLLEADRLGRCELVRGELVMMSPAGFRHGRVVNSVSRALGNYVDEHRLGVVLGAETGFQIERDPDTVRAPDVAFVQTARLPATEPVGFFPGPPDLAVEVVSPSDAASDVLAKTQQWLRVGCQAVWLVDPQNVTVSVYEPEGRATVLRAEDAVDGGTVVPGFRARVSQLIGQWP